MVKQIDVANRKGGTGKSENAIHIAVYLAQYQNKKVLLIDEDGSNCTLSTQLIKTERDPLEMQGIKPSVHPNFEQLSTTYPEWDGISSCASIFLEEEPVLPYPTYIDKLDLLPAYSSALNQIEGTHRNLIKKNIFEKYRDWKNSEALQKAYDYIVVDHAPTKTNIGDGTLNESDGLVIPIQARAGDINGMKVMLQFWTQINQGRTVDTPLRLLGIIINNYDGRRGVEQMILEDVQNNAAASKYLVPQYINASKYLQEKSYERSLTQEGTIFDLPDSNKIKQKLISVCDHIYKGVE